MRTDGVLCSVQALIEFLLLGEQHQSAVFLVSHAIVEGVLVNSAFDVAPNVWRVVSVQVDDCLRQID